MSKIIVAINSGSSSLKFQLFQMPEEVLLVKGLFERIGLAPQIDFSYTTSVATGKAKVKGTSHVDAVHYLLNFLLEEHIINKLNDIEGVGHRVAHGGEYFKFSCMIKEREISKIRELCQIAPLHNPVNLVGIEAFQKELANVKQVAVFDTAFHQTIPAKNYVYPISYKFYEEDGIRRYGFHGTSHQYVALEAAKHLGKPLENLKVISAHLGNGASVTGILDGKSTITSMGFTPLAGLMMGTRCGDIDPSIIPFLQTKRGMTAEDITTMMNNQSGFLGVSKLSNDSRDIIKAAKEGNELAQLALDIFTSRVKQTIGAYAAELGGIDVLIFTAGIGENAPKIRATICEGLKFLGIKIDPTHNEKNELFIHQENEAVKIMIIPTNEELMIARDTFKLVK